MTATRKWSLLAAVLVMAILAAGWFLLISPKRSDAAAFRDETTSQDEQNDRLEQQIAMLQALQKDLPAQRAKLEVFRDNIPDNPALPTLIRSLTAAGRKTGVSVDSLMPAPPVALTGSTLAAAPTAPSSDTTAGAAETPPAAAPAAPALFQVPVTVALTGTYFELEQYVNKLEKFKRSFQVVGFTLAEATIEDAAAAEIGLTLQGRVFLAPDVALSTAPAAPVETSTGSTEPTVAQ